MYPYLSFFGKMLPSYGLCITLGGVLCYLLSQRRAKRQGLSTDHLLIIAAVTVGFASLGAKLLYIAVTFSPTELLLLLRAKKLSALISGGFVFYGGLLGGLFGAWVGAKIAHTDLMRYEAAVVPFLPLAYGFGRIGCWLAGCCYGFVFRGGHFPVQLLDAAFSFLSCVFLIPYSKNATTGKTLILYLRIYSIQRFFLEFLRADTIRGVFWLLSTSQWISLALLLISVFYPILKKRTA